MESRLTKAHGEFESISDNLSTLQNAERAMSVELADASMKSLKAHLDFVTSPPYPQTIKGMKARIALSKKSDEAEKARALVEGKIKDLKQQIIAAQERKIALEAETKNQ